MQSELSRRRGFAVDGYGFYGFVPFADYRRFQRVGEGIASAEEF